MEIIGGTAAISAGVEAKLHAMGIAIERISGASRAETAIAVAEKRGARSAAEATHVVLVQGQEADAWAGGFAAAARSALLDALIVLAAESQLPPETTATYVRDLETGSTRHVSVDLEGTPVSRGQRPSLSAEGATVVYTGQGETGRQVSCACTWIWWRDLQGAAIGFVQTPDGQPVDGGQASRPQLSADGSVVVFQTNEPLLTADDNSTADVYLYDIASQTLEVVSVAPDGTAGSAEDRNPNPENGVSADGRYVAVTYSGGDLATGEDAGRGQTYLRDRQAGATIRVSRGGSGALGSAAGRPQISDDGSWVVFSSDRVLIPSSQQGCEVYRYDVAGGGLDRVDLGATTGGNANCPIRMDVSDASSVVFDHVGTLHAEDDHTGLDVFRASPRLGG